MSSEPKVAFNLDCLTSLGSQLLFSGILGLLNMRRIEPSPINKYVQPVAPPGFCNRGEVRYGSIGGLEYTKSPSPDCIVCVSTWLFARRPCNAFVV